VNAVGDRAIRELLDVFERVLAEHPGLAPGTLVIRCAFQSTTYRL